MAESHAAGWVPGAPTPAQLKEFFAQIESGKVTKDRLQYLLRGDQFELKIYYSSEFSSRVTNVRGRAREIFVREVVLSRMLSSKELIDFASNNMLRFLTQEDAEQILKLFSPSMLRISPRVAPFGSSWGGKFHYLVANPDGISALTLGMAEIFPTSGNYLLLDIS